jgi:hypothetical protein
MINAKTATDAITIVGFPVYESRHIPANVIALVNCVGLAKWMCETASGMEPSIPIDKLICIQRIEVNGNAL